MLVLSRKKNESIVVNDCITIVVVEIRGDKVRLGIDAPKHIPVHRREVFDAIQKENGVKTPSQIAKENVEKLRDRLAKAEEELRRIQEEGT